MITSEDHDNLIRNRLLIAGCPQRQVEKVVQDMEIDRDKVMALELSALLGGYGVGKTQVAVEVLRQFSVSEDLSPRDFEKPRRTVRYSRAWDAMDEIKAGYNRDGLIAAMQAYIRPYWLVLDELDSMRGTEWESQALDNLIDKRYAARKRTILIANMTDDHDGAPGAPHTSPFRRFIGERAYSRLTETGGIKDCSGWPNRRRNASAD